MINRKFGRLLVMLLALVIICLHSVSPSVYAIVSKNGTISLNVADSGTGEPIEGISFRLYFFAAAYESGNGVGYNYVIPYDDCKMDMDNLQDAYLPIHLTHFANTHNLPYTEKISDVKGHIVFENLVPGVYLIVPAESVDNYFMPTPFVINIPLYDDNNKNWVYDINASPKMRIYGGSEANSFTYISVKKVWETEGNHPDSVTVSLLRDFSQVDTVELNAENNWTFRWNNLSEMHTWSVVENVPDGYTVSYETSSNTVTIYNRSTSENPPSQPDEEETTAPELIYTGQLNWPIPVFSIAGLLLFSLGWVMLNFGKKDEDVI